ncbi:MAG TPA: hypothetical protein PKM78_02990 [Anaerolineae bacterium]|nr:hypothetical protein [Anaerolineae bacterium]
MTDESTPIYEQRLRRGGESMLRESGAYFAGVGALHVTLARLARRLAEEGIAYALIGGLAMAEHGYVRLTADIDLVLTASGLERFNRRLVGRGYRPAFQGAAKTFRDTDTGVRIEILTAGEYPGDGLPKPVAFPDPGLPGVVVEIEGVHVVALERLIELKLASGLSAPHRLRDLADVQDLILYLELPLSLENALDPSVRAKYVELWEQVQASGLGSPGPTSG